MDLKLHRGVLLDKNKIKPEEYENGSQKRVSLCEAVSGVGYEIRETGVNCVVRVKKMRTLLSVDS